MTSGVVRWRREVVLGDSGGGWVMTLMVVEWRLVVLDTRRPGYGREIYEMTMQI